MNSNPKAMFNDIKISKIHFFQFICSNLNYKPQLYFSAKGFWGFGEIGRAHV